MKKISSPLLILLTLLLSTTAFSQLNETNWLTHPKVNEVRAIVTKVNNAVSDGDLKKYLRDIDSQGEYTQTKEISVDGELKIRLLNIQQSSETGSYDAKLYYDLNTSLRFIYIIITDYSGGELQEKIEYRIYFSTAKNTLKPLWVAQSKNGVYVALGSDLNLDVALESLNIQNPYLEYHDAD